MGETEPFPVLVQYRVGTIAAGKLRHTKVNEARVTWDDDAIVTPLAQRDLIDLIIDGINPQLRSKLVEDIGRWSSHPQRRKESQDKIFREKRQEEFATYLRDESWKDYVQPFMQAISALPRQDLAKMAEALVNLTAFLMRMAADRDETVAGPVDVALLSKGDGFIWAKRKELLPQAGMIAV